MLIYQSIAGQIENHFDIGIQGKAGGIVKNPLMAGAEAVVFGHFQAVIDGVSPEKYGQSPVVRIIRYWK